MYVVYNYKIVYSYTTINLLEVLVVFLATYEPTHVARNTTKTYNKLKVVGDYIILH